MPVETALAPRDVRRADRLLAQVLPQGSLYAVGGRVRDELRSELDGERRASLNVSPPDTDVG